MAQMAPSGTSDRELSLLQQKAIAALLETKTVPLAAKRAGVALRTLYRWLAEDELFKATLRHYEGDILNATVRALMRLNKRAVAVMEDILNDEEVSGAIRARVAMAIPELSVKMRDLNSIEERLANIERMLTGAESDKVKE